MTCHWLPIWSSSQTPQDYRAQQQLTGMLAAPWGDILDQKLEMKSMDVQQHQSCTGEAAAAAAVAIGDGRYAPKPPAGLSIRTFSSFHTKNRRLTCKARG